MKSSTLANANKTRRSIRQPRVSPREETSRKTFYVELQGSESFAYLEVKAKNASDAARRAFNFAVCKAREVP